MSGLTSFDGQIAGPVVAEPSQPLGGTLVDVDDASAPALGRSLDQPLLLPLGLDGGDRASHGDGAVVDVDVLPPQAEQLAAAHSGSERDLPRDDVLLMNVVLGPSEELLGVLG